MMPDQPNRDPFWLQDPELPQPTDPTPKPSVPETPQPFDPDPGPVTPEEPQPGPYPEFPDPELPAEDVLP
ncbi:MAG: hypothetical protein HKP40_09075 [Litoreibacter sp.]|nr:hypothetical protein [Litoreibacter sp.]